MLARSVTCLVPSSSDVLVQSWRFSRPMRGVCNDELNKELGTGYRRPESGSLVRRSGDYISERGLGFRGRSSRATPEYAAPTAVRSPLTTRLRAAVLRESKARVTTLFDVI